MGQFRAGCPRSRLIRARAYHTFLPLILLFHPMSALKGVEATMNWDVIVRYLPLYQEAAWLTVKLGLAGIAISIVVGLLCAVIQYYKVPVLRRVVAVYIELSRNTPLLVQLFFIYYGLPKIELQIDAAA